MQTEESQATYSCFQCMMHTESVKAGSHNTQSRATYFQDRWQNCSDLLESWYGSIPTDDSVWLGSGLVRHVAIHSNLPSGQFANLVIQRFAEKGIPTQNLVRTWTPTSQWAGSLIPQNGRTFFQTLQPSEPILAHATCDVRRWPISLKTITVFESSKSNIAVYWGKLCIYLLIYRSMLTRFIGQSGSDSSLTEFCGSCKYSPSPKLFI